MKSLDLDHWLPRPAVRVAHQRSSAAPPEALWQAAQAIRLDQTRMLGRLIRWRIPGTSPRSSFQELFSSPPFCVLRDQDLTLITGLVGRIWTLRRDYPTLSGPDEFQAWTDSGTAKVMFAHWVAPGPEAGATLHSETRVQAFGLQGRIGLGSVRPLIRTFQHLVATDAMAAAARMAEA